jgi:hypothetical protein
MFTRLRRVRQPVGVELYTHIDDPGNTYDGPWEQVPEQIADRAKSAFSTLIFTAMLAHITTRHHFF